jgi:outer membrane receptor protein involved in Fe transport
MRVLSTVFGSLVLVCSASAQTSSATVVGRVTDATGAVVTDVSIRVTNLGTNVAQRGSSNQAGDFTIPYLNPGRYYLEASAKGFRTYKHTHFTLEVAHVLRIDISLQIGAATESITVTDAPTGLNTESGTRGDVTTNLEIAEIPLDGRNFSDLAYLTGGVIPRGDGGDGSFAVNGARADNTGFMIDGMNNTQRRNTGAMINPPLEGVQEFKMMTSGYSAEYGRYAGGMLTVVTKSGTNRVRGALYEFLRNDDLDATGYFDVQKSKLRRNQFGATVGGPVYLPKVYDGRNRTFFMVTWESLRSTSGKSQRGIVPLPEMLRGDFSKATDAFGKPLRITDTLAKSPFPDNQIPLTRMDPVSLKMAAYFPTPNLTGSANNFISQGNSTSSFDNFGIKIDHNITDSDRLTASAFWQTNSSWDPVADGRSPLPIFGSRNNPLNLLSYVRYIRSITPTIYLEASANFSRKTNNQAWPYSADHDWASDIGFSGGTTNPIARGLPQVEAVGYIILGPAYDLPKIWSYNNYQYSASLTSIKGRHSVKYGGDVLHYQYFSRSYGDTRGRFQFNGRFTGESFADMLLGWVSSSRRQLDAGGPYHLLSSYAGFVQDDFKISPTLTLNLGVRYDVMKPPKEKFNSLSMFIPDLGKQVMAGTGVLSASDFDSRIASVGSQNAIMARDIGLPDTIISTDYTNFAPRFGFAWRPFGQTETVVRGGYGIFYGSSSLYRLDEYSDTFPYSITQTFSISSSDPTLVTLSKPFPVARQSVSGVTSTYGQPSTSPKSQYIQSWSLTVERELAHSIVLEIAYAGSKGTHLQRRYDINQAYREVALRNLRPFPAFSSINIVADSSNSNYNSGSLTLRRRLSNQFFIRAAYTFAKSIDETSNTGGTIQYNFPIAQDSRNLKAERGRSDFDIGHSFAASLVWAPKISRNTLLRDWQVSGTSTIYTGPPFTPKLATVDYTNGSASRPDRLAKGTLNKPTPDQWFDRTAFPIVPLGSYRWGTSGRNVLDGPGTLMVNMGLSRKIQFAENQVIQVRVDSLNLPNHPNFNLPENRVDILSGGTITRAKTNRTLAVGVRLEF